MDEGPGRCGAGAESAGPCAALCGSWPGLRLSVGWNSGIQPWESINEKNGRADASDER